MDAEGDVVGIDPFFESSTLYAAMDMEFGPDGSLYVLDYGNGGYFTGNENSAVYKINAINEGARSPSASASATPDSGAAPLAVQFSSAGSSDPDAGDSIVSYAWDFQNDGTVDSTAPNPTFTYTQTGVYDARLTVTDATGRTGVATAVVTVGNTRPTVEIELPPNGGVLRVRRLRPGQGQRDRPRGRGDRLLQGGDRLHPRPRLARPPAQLPHRLRRRPADRGGRGSRRLGRTSSGSSTPATPTRAPTACGR